MEYLINTPENISDLKMLPLVTTNNPNNRNIIPDVRQLNNIWETNIKMPKVLPNTKSSTVRGSPRNSKLKSSFQQRTIQVNDGEKL